LHRNLVLKRAGWPALYNHESPPCRAPPPPLTRARRTSSLPRRRSSSCSYGTAPTPSERPRSKEELIAAKRRQELLDFYKKHDPDKGVDKVDELLANYPFEGIVSSLKIKFKSSPPVSSEQAVASSLSVSHSPLSLLIVRACICLWPLSCSLLRRAGRMRRERSSSPNSIESTTRPALQWLDRF